MAFPCPNCRHQLHLEESACPSCAHAVGYDWRIDAFRHLDPRAREWHDAEGSAAAVKPCANVHYGACNWLADETGAEALGPTRAMCRACRHNRMIPDLAVRGVLQRWRRIEEAKRRMIRGAIKLGLPLETKAERGDGLAFDFLYDAAAENGYVPQLLTGHAGGVITLNVIEADDAARERIRHQMGEPYRTLLGHFRHEIGHYYWYRLVAVTDMHDPFRALFGDERIDYAAAVQRYYAGRPALGWADDHVSAYATAHPWEDFAETFAHYLHIVDTLGAMADFGVGLEGNRAPHPDIDAYRVATATLVERWIPISFALNAVNRAIGQPDLYPFRLSPGVMLKLDFVSRLIARAAGREEIPEGSELAAMIANLGHGV